KRGWIKAETPSDRFAVVAQVAGQDVTGSLQVRVTEVIEDLLVLLHTGLPVAAGRAWTEAFEKDRQQVVERHQRLDSARVEQSLVKGHIRRDALIEVGGSTDLVGHLGQSRVQGRVVYHPPHDVRQDSGFDHEAGIDQLRAR